MQYMAGLHRWCLICFPRITCKSRKLIRQYLVISLVGLISVTAGIEPHQTDTCFEQKVSQTERCLCASYPRRVSVIMSLPAGGHLSSLREFCSNRRYREVESCLLHNVTSCEPRNIKITVADPSNFYLIWSEMCDKNFAEIESNYNCYVEQKEGFNKCRKNLRESIDRRLGEFGGEPITLQDRLLIHCSEKAVAVVCDYKTIEDGCGSEAVGLVAPLLYHSNLWLCGNYPLNSQSEMVHFRGRGRSQTHAAVFGLITNSNKQGCMTESLASLDLCLAKVKLYARHHHAELFIAEGHTHFVDTICKHISHVDSCLQRAVTTCTDLKRLYNVTGIGKAVGKLCHRQKDYEKYSEKCYKHLKPKMRECMKKAKQGENCRDNRELNRCVLREIEYKCGQEEAEILKDIHSARLPKGCDPYSLRHVNRSQVDPRIMAYENRSKAPSLRPFAVSQMLGLIVGYWIYLDTIR